MRPSSWDRFRVNSPRPAYEAHTHNVNEDSVDCGIKVLKCCDTPRCRMLGTTKTFLTVLIVLGIVQGICEKFITISVHQAALEHDFNASVIEWLFISNGIVQGVFALLIAYWGNRIHKISWLCGMVIFQSFTALIVIIPTLTHSESSASSSTISLHSVNLECIFPTSASLSLAEIPHSITTLIGLFILQIGLSYGFIAFFTLGLTYLDDNSIQHNIPALLGSAIASRYLGFVFGNLLSMFMRQVSLGWWLGWAIICPILLTVAIIIGLFPRRMISAMVRQAADTIVETATNSSQLSLSRKKFLSDISFFPSMARLFRNKILLLNIAATVFIQTALINFTYYEQSYLQSRFLMPADESDILNNEWTSRTLSKFIQPLVVSLAILIGGLVIAKASPSPRKIIIWNVITALIVCLLFISFIFIECSHSGIAGAYGNKLSMPYCSRGCSCDPDIRFTPVCPNQSAQTYFSPCHAGCASEMTVNGERKFVGCTCGIDPDMSLINNGVLMVSEGACGYENCQKMWIIFQVLVAFGAVCIGSRLVGKILISIRSGLRQDTSIALALELTFVGFIAYIPGLFAYKAIADSTCQYWSSNNSLCYLHNSQDFGNYINILSAALSLIAVILDAIMLFMVKELDLYEGWSIAQPRLVEMRPIHRPAIETAIDDISPAVESNQPLLSGPANGSNGQSATTTTSQTTRPIISAPIKVTTSSPIPTESVAVTEAKPTMSNRYTGTIPKSKSPTALRYSPVYKQPDNHIEELNFRLKSINDRIHIKLTETDGNSVLGAQALRGDDINPSVGSDTEKEVDINIQHLESTVSSLSPLPSSVNSTAFNSPETATNRRNKNKNWHAERYETDF